MYNFVLKKCSGSLFQLTVVAIGSMSTLLLLFYSAIIFCKSISFQNTQQRRHLIVSTLLKRWHSTQFTFDKFEYYDRKTFQQI